MDVFLVIGNTRTRKSSLVRSLSGCFNMSERDIQPLAGPVRRVWVRAVALQATGMRPADAVAQAHLRRCDTALYVLWPTAHPHAPHDYPDAASYIRHFESAGWRLRAAAVLGQNAGGLRGPHVLQLPQAGNQPINATAHAVREHFGWV